MIEPIELTDSPISRGPYSIDRVTVLRVSEIARGDPVHGRYLDGEWMVATFMKTMDEGFRALVLRREQPRVGAQFRVTLTPIP